MNDKEENPDNLEGLGQLLPAEVLEKLNAVLEQLHRAEHPHHGSKIEIVYVASGGQHVEHVDKQYFYGEGRPKEKERPVLSNKTASSTELIRESITRLMAEQQGDEPLFNLQGHWQAVYRILVDKGYCRDSDFDGFDTFIRTVMPEEVNKPYSKGSLKQISQTDFSRPFLDWKFDPETSKTRKPFDRMVAVAERFKGLLEEKGL